MDSKIKLCAQIVTTGMGQGGGTRTYLGGLAWMVGVLAWMGWLGVWILGVPTSQVPVPVCSFSLVYGDDDAHQHARGLVLSSRGKKKIPVTLVLTFTFAST